MAQSGKTTVRLRNGSVLIGTLSKSRDGSRMRIETPNGSVIYFTEKAIKEMVEDVEDDFDYTPNRRQTNNNRSSSRYNDLYEDDDIPPLENTTNSRYQNQRRNSNSTTRNNPLYDITGYRGFADLGYTIGMGDYSYGRFEIATSHGYQIDPYFFIGGGIGFHFYSLDDYSLNLPGIEASTKSKLTAIPIFADFRANFADKGNIIPFAGLKAGYSIGISKTTVKVASVSESESNTEGLGFYLAPAIGAKYKITPSLALNLSLGYTFQFAKMIDIDIDTSGNIVSEDEKNKNVGGISFKLGVEF